MINESEVAILSAKCWWKVSSTLIFLMGALAIQGYCAFMSFLYLRDLGESKDHDFAKRREVLQMEDAPHTHGDHIVAPRKLLEWKFELSETQWNWAGFQAFCRSFWEVISNLGVWKYNAPYFTIPCAVSRQPCLSLRPPMLVLHFSSVMKLAKSPWQNQWYWKWDHPRCRKNQSQ